MSQFIHNFFSFLSLSPFCSFDWLELWKTKFSIHWYFIHIFLLYDCVSVQEGDVIELCQVSDIRAGGVPKVSGCQYYAIIFEQKKIIIKFHSPSIGDDTFMHIILFHCPYRCLSKTMLRFNSIRFGEFECKICKRNWSLLSFCQRHSTINYYIPYSQSK